MTTLEMRTRIMDLLSDSSAATQTLAGDLMNDYYHLLYALFDWDFDETRRTITTEASTQFYELPADCRKLMHHGVQVTSGGYTYSPQEVVDEEFWNVLNSTSQTSDIPSYFFVRGGEGQQTVGLWPTPATTSNTITLRYKSRTIDLSFPANYTTGTIVTLTNGASAVTGAGSTWTAAMIGRFFRIDGDGRWYRVSARSANTAITIQKPYLGTAIAAGAETYVIAEVAYVPEEFQLLLVYGPLSDLYYRRNEENRGLTYKGLFDQMLEKLKKSAGKKTMSIRQPNRTELMEVYSVTDGNENPVLS